MPKNGIPDRWTDYQALGKRIPGTRFVAFKVPLKQALRRFLPPAEAFGPLDLIRLLGEEKQELGLIVDLTFTTRYYKPEDLPEGVHYVKIFTAGHEVPSDPTILSFKKAVKKFLHDNQANDKLIGVHCTHGLNRTGYLVCRYLIDVEGVDPGEAIELFNRSRGHSIERKNYLEDLFSGPRRCNRGMDEPDQELLMGHVRQNRERVPSSHPHGWGPLPGAPRHVPLHHRSTEKPLQRFPGAPRVPPPLPRFGMRDPRPLLHEQDCRWPSPYHWGPRPSFGEVWRAPNGPYNPYRVGPHDGACEPQRRTHWRTHKRDRNDWS